MHRRTLVAPVVVQRRGIEVGDNLIVACVVQIDRCNGRLICVDPHDILLKDSADGRVVQQALAQRLELGGQDGLVGKVENVVLSAVLVGIVDLGASEGGDDFVVDGL